MTNFNAEDFTDAPPLFDQIGKQLDGHDVETIHVVLVNLIGHTFAFIAEDKRAKWAADLKEKFGQVIDYYAMTAETEH
jgi:hypothetical protein